VSITRATGVDDPTAWLPKSTFVTTRTVPGVEGVEDGVEDVAGVELAMTTGTVPPMG